MIPKPEQMQALAVAMEGVLHEHGWDQPPFLGIVLAKGGGDDVVFVTLPFPVQPQDVDPTDAIAGMVWLGGELLVKPDLASPPPPGVAEAVAGVLFAAEAWHTGLAPEERGGRKVADLPDSREARTVYVLDCGGRFTMCARIRGEEPEVDTSEPGSTEWQAAGRLVDGMRKILIWIAREMPFGSVDLDKLREVGVNKPDWMADEEDLAT